MKNFKYWVGRAAFRLLRPLIRGYLNTTKRARIVLINDKGEFLVIKRWLSDQSWQLPGGGIGKKESSQEAALRELREETGVEIEPEAISYIGTMKHEQHGFIYTYDVFMARATKQNCKIHKKYERGTIQFKWMGVQALENSTYSQEVKDLLLTANSKI